MKNIIEYKRGGNNGSIIEGTNGYFTAVTATTSKDYKTIKGAEKFMAKMGYERV